MSSSYGGSETGTSGYVSAYNHPGVPITASAGDDGYAVEFPASAPYVTAVGGTSLTLNSSNQRASETVWSGTGSGCSRTYARQSWQTPVLPAAGVCSRRVVGDVAAVADPGTGVSVYDSYAGNGGSYDLEPLPYALGHQGTNLFDVTSGRNGNCRRSYLCTAGPGYDGPTGLGTPIGVSAS